MPDQEKPGVIDLRFLNEASASLLGYFVHTWFTHYLTVIAASLRGLYEQGLIKDLVRPTERGRHVLFDFGALNLEKLAYIVGIYVYILCSHKAANYRLMHRYDGKRVLFLRGYDYEGAVSEAGAGVGFSAMHTMVFGGKLSDLIEPDSEIVRVLSPKDVYWETADAQRYFGGDYEGMIGLVQQMPCSIYLNADGWREGVADLLDRVDHYVVYVSSITESVLWELQQLDTDERRARVTVVFDEEAIANKELQLRLQAAMREERGEGLIWSKQEAPLALTGPDLRARLSGKFLVTTPDEFEADIDRHRQRIAESSSRLRPGARETWIDFRFHPKVDADRLAELRQFSADMDSWIEGGTRDGIACLPLFVDQVQLRIYTTLLLGEHDQTGRALAAYAGAIRATLDYYASPGEKIGGLSPANREGHLEMLREHLGLAEYAGLWLLACGKSHQFDDFSAAASDAWDAIFETTTAAVAAFFAHRGGPLPASPPRLGFAERIKRRRR
jgi:hypothetical protein